MRDICERIRGYRLLPFRVCAWHSLQFFRYRATASVVVEPHDVLGVPENRVHDGAREAEVEDVDIAPRNERAGIVGLVISEIEKPTLKVEVNFPILHRHILSLIAELEPSGERRTKTIRTGGVIQDQRFHWIPL